jgi:hypothetical protein
VPQKHVSSSILLFQKKKQKALFRFAEVCVAHSCGGVCGNVFGVVQILPKSLPQTPPQLRHTKNNTKPTDPGTTIFFFFQKKKQKA